MLQLLYVSRADPPARTADLDAIFEQSRHNNAIDGITGMLWSDGSRFLQVLEGPDQSVDACFARIRQDRRHFDVSLLFRDAISARQFGTWSMERRRQDSADAYDARMRRLLGTASPAIVSAFQDLISDREAA